MCKELRMASLLNHIVQITAHRDHRDRSAARTRDIPRIIGAAIQWVIALQIHQQLRHVGFAQYDRAGCAQAGRVHIVMRRQ